jgi:tetratricopeptide (TPR) repeat protein
MTESNQTPGAAPPPSEPSTGQDSQIQPFVLSFPDDPISYRDWGLWAGVMALLTLVAFWQSIPGYFLWDDDSYVTHNAQLLNRGGLVRIWDLTHLGTVQYYPLTFTVLWIEHHIWQNGALGYRVVDLLLHAAAAIVLWRVLRRLRLPGAWAVAATWAIHPLQVETVAWVSELKNVLSGFLAISSLLFYLDFAGLRDPDSEETVWQIPDRWQTYAISLLAFVAALLSKTAVCGLPLALLAILWWKRKLDAKTFAGLIPMFVLGLVGGLLTSYLEVSKTGLIQATGPEWDLSFIQRLLIAGHSFWFYLGKIFWPVNLSFNYPRLIPDPHRADACIPLVAAIIVIDLLYVFRKAIGRGPLTAAVCYFAAIFPALGFFNVYPFRYSFVADHFQYLAAIPVIALAVSFICRVIVKHAVPLGVGACLLLLILGSATWARAKVFSDPILLWQDTLDKNPNSWLAAYNLARDRMNDATKNLTLAGQLAADNEPDASEATAEEASAQLDDAQNLLGQVIANPITPPTYVYLSHSQLAGIDVTRTRWPGANIQNLMSNAESELTIAISGQRALSESIPSPLPCYNMGLVQMKIAEYLQKQLPPSPAATRPATADEQKVIDRFDSARDFLQQAIDAAKIAARHPTTAEEAEQLLALSAFQRGNADFSLGGLAEQRGDTAASDGFAKDAITDYNLSLVADPANVEAHYRLALCLERFGDLRGAKTHLLSAMLYSPSGRYAPAYNEMGWIICRSTPTNMSQLQLAIQCFQDAIGIDPNYKDAKDNLKKAMDMLKSAKVTTEPSTEQSSAAATQPSPQ